MMAAFQPVKASWVSPLKKGTTQNKVLTDTMGFRLHYKKKDEKKKYYHCSRKDDLQCPVRVTLDISSDMIVSEKGEHNHDNELVENTVKKLVKNVFTPAVANPSVGGRSVMKDISSAILNNVGQEGLSYMPSPKTISATLSRKRKREKNFPPIPHSWDEMKVPECFQKTSDGQDFCILEEQVPGTNMFIWGFASMSGMTVMANSEEWFIDGTFELVDSTLFKQVWVIVCPIHDSKTSIPVAFFFLPGKEYSLYKIVLDLIKEKAAIITQPKNIHMDFELGPLKAVKAVFPMSKIITCDFHWKQCIMRKLQDLGLKKYFSSDLEIQTYVRYLWCLTLVPPDQVVIAWDQFVKKNVPELDEDNFEDEDDKTEAASLNLAIQQLTLYFENTWIGGENKRNPEIPRRKPKFPVFLWNKYADVMNNEQLTNNRSETWNSVSKLDKVKNASVWTVLDTIRKEEALGRAKLLSAAVGSSPVDHPARKMKEQKRREQLRDILGKWGEVDISGYFAMLAGQYNDFKE